MASLSDYKGLYIVTPEPLSGVGGQALNDNFKTIADNLELLEGVTTSSSGLISHLSDTNNPHEVTQTQIGLSNVLNEVQAVASGNLSDLTDFTEARSNLGLGSSAILPSGTLLDASNIMSGIISNERTTGSTVNTPNSLVLRDSSGNFSTGSISATVLSGNGAGISAINASNISTGTLSNNRTSGTTSATPNTLVLRDSSGNFSSGQITSTKLIGSNLTPFRVAYVGPDKSISDNINLTFDGFTLGTFIINTGLINRGLQSLNFCSNDFATAGTNIQMSYGTSSAITGNQIAVAIRPAYNQSSGDANNTDLEISRTETGVGSGNQYLIHGKVNDSTVFSVSNTGSITGIGSNITDVPQSGVTNLISDLADKASSSNLTTHIDNISNPHSVTAAQVGAYSTATVDSLIASLETEVVPIERNISTTAPLQGGGNLSDNRTLSIDAATTLTAGSMSAAHFTLINGATDSATANTIVKRHSDGGVNFAGSGIIIETGDGINLGGGTLTLSPNGNISTSGAMVASSLSVSGTASITIGTDTNLYRSSADVLKTDDSFWCASTLFSNSLRASSATTMTMQQFTWSTASGSNGTVRLLPTFTNTSGDNVQFRIGGVYNQASGSGSNTDLLISRTETAVSSGNQFLIDAQVGGTSKFSVANTGQVLVGSGGTQITISGTNGTVYASSLSATNFTTANNNVTMNLNPRGFSQADKVTVNIAPTSITNSSGTYAGLKITTPYTQTGTASGTDFLISRTETSVGSGAQLLIDAQVGGTSKFKVDNAGNVTIGGQVTPSTQTLTDGANISWNLNSGISAVVTLGGNRTLDNPTNMINGATYILRVVQDGTGSRTLAYGTSYKWPGGIAPTLSVGAGDVDILTFVSDGTNMYGNIAKDFS